ncbi:TPA: alpha/beta hydrolase [Streptococcus suis]
MITKKIKSKRDGLELELAIIEPSSNPIGIVQLVHGMSEHKERYYDFMNYLAQNGYVCAIHDHRGHGASVKDSSHLGYFYTEDSSVIVDDAYQVTEYLKERYPSLSISIFSHSRGTLVSRNYLKKYDYELDKIVLCGPPTENKLAGFAVFLAKISSVFYGKYKPNKFFNSLSAGQYSKGYESQLDWICANPDTVKEYDADPLCGFIFTTNAFINLFKLLKSAYNGKDWRPKNTALPIFLIAGEDDPVIQGNEKFKGLEGFLKSLGYKNIKSKLYKGMRHEILNERDKETIYQDVLEFLRSDTNKKEKI